MKGLLLPVIVVAFFALAAACGEEATGPSSTASPTPSATPSPSFAPILQRATPPVPLDATTVKLEDHEGWFTVNPETGEYQPRPLFDGRAPSRLAGNRFALMGEGGPRPAVLDAATNTITDIGPGWSGEVSPDGRYAAVIPETEGPTLIVVAVESGKRFDLGEAGKPVQMAWSQDGRLALVKEGRLFMAQAPQWTPREVGPLPYFSPKWSPAGQWLAATASDGIHLVSPDMKQDAVLLSSSAGLALPPGATVSWSPDGHRLAFSASAGVYLVSIDTGEVTNVFPPSMSPILPFWSPDGSALAFVAPDSVSKTFGIWVAKADGSGAYQITKGSAAVIGWRQEGIIAWIGPK